MEMGVERALKKYLPNGTQATASAAPIATGIAGISGRLPHLYLLWYIKMRISTIVHSGSLS